MTQKLVYILLGNLAGSFLFFTLIWSGTYYWKYQESPISKYASFSTISSGSPSSPCNNKSGVTVINDDDGTSHPLAHPKAGEELWIEMDRGETLIRRLGYIDDRFGKPFIVLISVISMYNEKIKKRINYFAKITYHSNNGGEEEQQCLPLEYWIKNGEINVKHYMPEIYANYILQTKGSLLKGKTPHHLTVTKNCKTGRESKDIIIWSRKNVKRRVKYGVCLHKALFNINDPQLLVDWIEIHKALGVEYITVFIQDVPETVVDAIQPYIKEGLVDLIDWKLGKLSRDFCQKATLAECHYLNMMYSVEYLGLYDLDEIIVPFNHAQWKGMFEELSKKNPKFDNYVAFQFRGLNWHDGHDNETINPSETCTTCAGVNLPFYFRKTIRDDKPHDPPKMIIRPLSSKIIIGIHNMGIKGIKKMMVVDHKIATSNHYRVPDRSEKYNPYHDDVMSRYKESVYCGIRKTLCK